jgi:lipid II:glycine glycyltransferase (peptidoglycan interpeptide bridge formation enzyme)
MAGAALREEYVTRRKLLLRISPYIFGDETAEPEGTLMRLGFSRSEQHPVERTIILDISRPLPEVRDGLDKDWRRCLRRAEEQCLEVREGNSPEMFDEFLPVYTEMLDRKNLTLEIDPKRWALLQSALPDAARQAVFLVRNEGKAVAGLIVSSLGDTGYPTLAASTGSGMKCHASHLMHWRAISWLKEMGCKRYDLVGIDPERNPGTYRFKKGFRGKEVSYIGVFESCDSGASAAIARLSDRMRSAVRSRVRDRIR